MVRTSFGRAWIAAMGAALSGLAGCPACVKDGGPPPSPQAAPPGTAGVGATSAQRTDDASGSLRSPIDVEARRRIAGSAMPDPPPPSPQPPVRDLIGVSFYIDKSHSVVDPALKRQNEEAVRPVRAFVATVTALADGWMRSSPARPAYAIAALGQLRAWAAAGALLGDVNRQGGYERKWTLGGLAMAFLEIRGAPGLDAADLAVTRGWLSKLAYAVIPEYDDMKNSASHNNHAYWAGFAVAATAVATNDRRLFDWGMTRAHMGLADVRSDGTLPNEMARGALALHYHAFALPPLVLLAEIGAANGVALYEENDRALQRLADRVLRGFDDPASFEKLAGVAQEFPLATHPRASYYAWGEAYYARFRDARLLRWITAASRPLIDQRLGGDQTLAFGVVPLPAGP